MKILMPDFKMTRWLGLLLAILGLVAPGQVLAVGSWTPLANLFTNSSGAGHMMLLSDGTVMVQNNGGNYWARLSPDNHGHYVNGTWSALASMHDSRSFYSSQVLTDGRVFVAGAEYGNGGAQFDVVGARAEIYDPVANTWTQINPPSALLNYTTPPGVSVDTNKQAFFDSASMLLPDGTVLVGPVDPAIYNGTLIYNPFSNTWTNGPLTVNNPQGIGCQAEATWVKLANDSILTIDPGGNNVSGTNTERYIPSLGKWVVDTSLPIPIYDQNPTAFGEMGAAFLLPNGNALYFGASGHTAYYAPGGGSNKGSWTPGPDIPAGLAASDAPAAMMVNGRILAEFVVDSNHRTNYFYEFDPVAKSYTQVPSPTGGLTDSFNICDRTSMLDLPDGTVLYNDSSQRLYVYTPDPTVPIIASGKPVINSITWNGNGSIHLAGTGFNGISAGAAYGDEAQQDSNYPLAIFTDGGGNVTYGRTVFWSSTGVQTGSNPVTTELVVPGAFYYNGGNYSLQVEANGIASDPVSITGPIWVDFTYGGSTQSGTYALPYNTLAQGVGAVPFYGAIYLKPGLSHETFKNINSPMTIEAMGGPATIGQ
jgi:hypothetical protein